jgi:dolichol kinase
VIATIEWGKLFELIWVAVLASAAVSVIFAVVILGAAKAETAHRRGDHVSAIAYGLLGALALTAFFGSVVFAVSIIITK